MLWCFRLYFVLPCFINLILLQLLVKHNICISEMSNKHCGSCSVRSNGWESVFLVQNKTFRIKDVNMSQRKSIVCILITRQIFLRDNLKILIILKNVKVIIIIIIFLNLPTHSTDYSWSYVPGEQPLDFPFHSWFLLNTVQDLAVALCFGTCTSGHEWPGVSGRWDLQGIPDNLQLFPGCWNGA